MIRGSGTKAGYCTCPLQTVPGRALSKATRSGLESLSQGVSDRCTPPPVLLLWPPSRISRKHTGYKVSMTLERVWMWGYRILES